jgi:hypothetical protein
MKLRQLTYSLITSFVIAASALGQHLTIVSPKEGDVSLMTRQAVIVHGRPGLPVRLLANNVPIDSGEIRVDGAYDFIGEAVKPGNVTFLVEPLDGSFQNDSVHIHISGEPHSIDITTNTTEFKADGKSNIQFDLIVRDEFGVPIPSSYVITVKSDTGVIVSKDVDPNQAGIQVPIENGKAVFEMQPPANAAVATIEAFWGSVKAERDVEFTTPIEPLMLVGSANGSISSLSTTGNLSGLNDSSKIDDGTHTDGRLAFYGRGSIFGNYLLTASYDNERRQQDRVFQQLDPDILYSIYGDNSTVDYTAQSSNPLYIKIERNRSFLMYGDFNTQFDQTELGRYDRTFTGLNGHYEDKKDKADAFATLTNRTVVQQEIRGEGISGFYFLGNSNIVEGSEKVRIETRDKLHNEVILSRVDQTQFNDYDIDYVQGSLFFKQPVPSIDDNGNPVYIIVSYEAQSGAPTNYVVGGQGEREIAKGLTLGASAVTEERDPSNYTLFGANTKYSLGGRLNAAAEVAQSQDISSNGNAWRGEISGSPVSNLQLKGDYQKVDAGFTNETIGDGGEAEIGTEKYGASGTYNPFGSTKLASEYYHTFQDGSGSTTTINSVSGTVEQSVGSVLSGSVKVQNVQYQSGTDSTAADTKQSTLVDGKATVHATSRLNVTGEYVESISKSEADEIQPSVGTLGLDYKLFNNISLTAEQKFYVNAGASTVFGVASNVGYGTSVTGQYEIGNGIAGERNQASIGIKNTAKITSDLTSEVSYERARALDRNVIEVQTADHDAFSAGLEYLPKAPYKAAIKAEIEKDALSMKRNLTFGGDIRIARDFTFIDKLSLYDEHQYQTGTSLQDFAGGTLSADDQIGTQVSSGILDQFKNSAGVAYRPVSFDWLNLLAKLDYRNDYNGMVSPVTSDVATIGSLHAFVEPIQRLEVGVKYALKQENEQADGLYSTTFTDFYLANADYDLGWHNVDVSAEYRILSQREANDMKIGYSAELGYVLIKNIHVGVGYNFVGTKDQDLVSYTYWSRGPYVTMRMKFTEKILDMFNQ